MPPNTFSTPVVPTSLGPKLDTVDLQQLIDKVIPHIYPTVAVLPTDPPQAPNNVQVFGLKITGNDSHLSTVLANLAFSDLIGALAALTITVDTYQNGSKLSSANYRVEGTSADTSKVGSLSIKQIVKALGDIKFTVTNLSNPGHQKSFEVTSTVESSVEENHDLGVPIGQLTAKYVFLLKKLLRFCVTDVSGPQSGAGKYVALDGNKTHDE
jgi:hypothetical protein